MTRVALLGPEGTYTHQAAEEYFEDYEPVFYPTIREVFEAPENVKLVPVENSLGGGVSDTVDLLRKDGDRVTGEIAIQINHCLLSNTPIDEIDTVKSHPQALSQCQDFLSDKGWEQVEASSTAGAAEELDEGEAALASEIAGKINNLDILEKGVQDTDSNVTRFLVLNHEVEAEEKTALVLEPGEDRPGLLHSMLSCFAGHEINLSHIQSRPTGAKLGDYYFYVEAEAGEHDHDFEKARKCLETYADVKVLGSYRRGF